MSEKTRVAVCIITCQRPEGLKRLMLGLNELAFKRCAVPDLEIVVVDNDPAGSAREVLDEVRPEFRWPLKRAVEPRRGISFARNTAVACSSEDVDFIAFLDDDEVPETFWLDELLYVQQLYTADVVGGPVLPYFNDSVPSWVTEGKFFERPRHPTGSILKVAATNNCLVRRALFGTKGENFAPQLGVSGGEDTLFFMRVHRAGYRIVWADRALVHEWIPASRANARWVLRRAYGLGARITLCELEVDPSFSTRVRRLAKAGGRVVQGVLLIPLSPFMGGRRALYGALQYVSRGSGIIAGLAGKGYQEYREIHGA